MIHRSVEFTIKCDNCHEHLVFPDDTPLTSHVGHVISEGTQVHIQEVAVNYKWQIDRTKHLCPKCK